MELLRYDKLEGIDPNSSEFINYIPNPGARVFQSEYDTLTVHVCGTEKKATYKLENKVLKQVE